ncbi:MAG: SEL1-like repeat protein [Hyphomicrobiales bacterium]|nr:SEL1-like repeat protein [Hyphomicrobiales bacterium]
MERQGYQRATARADETPPDGGADHSQFHDRLGEIAARLDRLAQRTNARALQYGVSRAASASPNGNEEPVVDIDALDGSREPARPAASAGPSFSLDDAIAEISARQQALDAGHAEAAASSSVDLSGVERLLHDITGQIDTLRQPCAVENSVEALRRELAEVGRAAAEPRPQPSLDAVQAELRALSERIDRPRAPVEMPALSAIERGLNEVRDALNARPSAPVAAFNDDAPASARSGPDAASLDHLDSAIAELRNVSHRVASGDQLAALASDVRTLGAKLDRVSPSAAASPDGMEDLLHRMDALAAALENHPKPGDAAEGGPIETQLRRLTDKLDTVEAAADQRGFKQLEAQLAQLTQKLDAADARLGHLDTIEHAVADLVEQLQDARVRSLDAAEQAARAAVHDMMGGSAGGDVDALKHELADFRSTQADIDRRTQDMLETLQSTLERLVDRMSAIETDLPVMTAAPPVAPAPSITPAPVRTAPPIPEQRPLNTGLPADHPLEPGTGAPHGRASSPAERIAASEALLPPRPAGEPTGKANFIAAARRAAQAAAADASWEGSRATDDRPGSSMLGTIGGAISKRRRPLMIGIGVLLLVLGGFQIVSHYLGARQAAIETSSPRDKAPAPAPSTAPVPNAFVPAPTLVPPAPERRSETSPSDASIAKVAPAAEVPMTPAEGDGAPSEPKPGAMAPPPLMPGALNVTIPNEITGSTGATPPGIAIAPPPAAPAAPVEKMPPAEVGAGLRSAALAGNPAAEYELALRYTEGRGVPPSLGEAVHWLERAANHGLAPAQYRLGSLYEKGQGVKKDLETARRLYTAAATKGNGKAMHNLAVIYAEGISGEPDYRSAAQWFRKAADHGIPDSQYNLAILYARGIGVEQNFAESYKWLALAAQHGDKDAAKKRDEVAARLDAQSLAAARAAVQDFTAEPQPAEAVEVKPPPGGWEKPAAGAAHPPKVKSPVGAPRKLTPA